MASYTLLNRIFIRKYLFVVKKSRALFVTNNIIINKELSAYYSTNKDVAKSNIKEERNKMQTGLAEVVKENTKSIGYLSVIIGGIGVTAYIFYVIFNELFSSNSVNGIYTRTLEKCIKDTRIANALGEPIKAYGEETRRGRRGHVSHKFFMKHGKKHLRMRFYIQGTRRRGTVDLEMHENSSSKYEYTYLYVKIDDVIGSIIKLEENRGNESGSINLENSLISGYN